jgi:hypothetical protein
MVSQHHSKDDPFWKTVRTFCSLVKGLDNREIAFSIGRANRLFRKESPGTEAGWRITHGRRTRRRAVPGARPGRRDYSPLPRLERARLLTNCRSVRDDG